MRCGDLALSPDSLLFLYLDGVFDVFSVNNGLSYIDADLTYLNFCVGKINILTISGVSLSR